MAQPWRGPTVRLTNLFAVQSLIMGAANLLFRSQANVTTKFMADRGHALIRESFWYVVCLLGSLVLNWPS